MYKRYYGDPYWTTAKFRSKCDCGNIINKRDDIFYYPKQRKALCKHCGDSTSREFDSMAFDESMYNNQW